MASAMNNKNAFDIRLPTVTASKAEEEAITCHRHYRETCALIASKENSSSREDFIFKDHQILFLFTKINHKNVN